jgi:hypothetical protein
MAFQKLGVQCNGYSAVHTQLGYQLCSTRQSINLFSSNLFVLELMLDLLHTAHSFIADADPKGGTAVERANS